MTESQPERTESQPERKKNWFARHKILTVIGVIAVIVIIAIATNGGGGTKTTAANKSTPTAQNPDQAAKNSASTSKPSQAKPSPKQKTRDNASAQLTTLGAGAFTVGQDVPPGRYVITPGAGQSGNLTASTSDNPVTINEILGDAGGLGVPSVTSDLTKGETIKISGISEVTFTPAETKLLTSLGAGNWVVGLDIAAGPYVATPAPGQSGNFVIYDSSGLPATNEILGSAGGLGVPNVTVSLKDGDRIQISGMSEVTFKAK